MQKNKHLSDKEIIQYSRGQYSKLPAGSIEHLKGSSACAECMKKVEELKSFRRALRAMPDASEGCPPVEVCAYSDSIERYVRGSMNAEERGAFTAHLAACDACRDLTAVFHEVLKSEAARAAEARGRFIWLMLQNGRRRLSEVLDLGGTNAGFGRIAEAYRDGTGEDARLVRTMEIELPSDSGQLRILAVKQAKGVKVSVNYLSNVQNDLIIEIYESGRLLKSVEGDNSLSCILPAGSCLIVLNRTVEIPVEFSMA